MTDGEIFEKILLLKNNAIDKIKENVERYELTKLLRSTEEPSVAMKKPFEKVNT